MNKIRNVSVRELYLFLKHIKYYESGIYYKIKKRLMYRFISNEELKIAADLWYSSKCSAYIKYGNISLWDTSIITSMYKLFYDKTEFNDNINDWDVSNVENMSFLFANCIRFNRPLNRWNVSKVVNMTAIFKCCHEFNRPLSDWNVSNVESMDYMFSECYYFNKNIKYWNVRNVLTNKLMFKECDILEFNFDRWKEKNKNIKYLHNDYWTRKFKYYGDC